MTGSNWNEKGKGWETDDMRCKGNDKETKETAETGNHLRDASLPAHLLSVGSRLLPSPCVPRSVVSGSLRSPFHSLRVPRGKGDE